MNKGENLKYKGFPLFPPFYHREGVDLVGYDVQTKAFLLFV
jgi:hypothetical protein